VYRSPDKIQLLTIINIYKVKFITQGCCSYTIVKSTLLLLLTGCFVRLTCHTGRCTLLGEAVSYEAHRNTGISCSLLGTISLSELSHTEWSSRIRWSHCWVPVHRVKTPTVLCVRLCRFAVRLYCANKTNQSRNLTTIYITTQDQYNIIRRYIIITHVTIILIIHLGLGFHYKIIFLNANK